MSGQEASSLHKDIMIIARCVISVILWHILGSKKLLD